MTLRARAIIEAVLLTKGPIGSAEVVARELGLSNRFRLARLLEHEGLPPLHRVTEWVTVLHWIATAEREHVSLCWMAFRSQRHPSACYRLVKEVTGHGWEHLLAKGFDWALQRFLKELRMWGRRGQQRRAQNVLVVPPRPAYPKGSGAERQREASPHTSLHRVRHSIISRRSGPHPRG